MSWHSSTPDSVCVRGLQTESPTSFHASLFSSRMNTIPALVLTHPHHGANRRILYNFQNIPTGVTFFPLNECIRAPFSSAEPIPDFELLARFTCGANDYLLCIPTISVAVLPPLAPFASSRYTSPACARTSAASVPTRLPCKTAYFPSSNRYRLNIVSVESTWSFDQSVSAVIAITSVSSCA